MTPLERAARAAGSVYYDVTRNLSADETMRLADEAASTVLQAIREPSAQQLRAGREVLSNFDPVEGSAHQMAERVWRAMIDGAMEEGYNENRLV